MTIFEWLKSSQQELQEFPTARLDAEILLCHVLQKQKSYLITHEQEELKSEDLETLEQLLNNRKQGMPIAYITNTKAFHGRSFYVDNRVLIPRPETEELVEEAINRITRERHKSSIIDLGTGSGAIAITLAQHFPKHEVLGVDISDEALEVAEKNHESYHCKNVSFIHSDLLSFLPDEIFNKPLSILANLPYIGSQTHRHLSPETEKYEPSTALYGGPDGLDLYRKLWKQIKESELDIQLLVMEISDSQASIITTEAQNNFPNMGIEVFTDLSGHKRGIIVQPKREQLATEKL